jgi:hypothetical protein
MLPVDFYCAKYNWVTYRAILQFGAESAIDIYWATLHNAVAKHPQGSGFQKYPCRYTPATTATIREIISATHTSVTSSPKKSMLILPHAETFEGILLHTTIDNLSWNEVVPDPTHDVNQLLAEAKARFVKELVIPASRAAADFFSIANDVQAESINIDGMIVYFGTTEEYLMQYTKPKAFFFADSADSMATGYKDRGIIPEFMLAMLRLPYDDVCNANIAGNFEKCWRRGGETDEQKIREFCKKEQLAFNDFRTCFTGKTGISKIGDSSKIGGASKIGNSKVGDSSKIGSSNIGSTKDCLLYLEAFF